ncbi:hypothetical protein EDC94DRAFT_659997 [Helicostylum pulchrum]|nr:hypothetical protein EDC94DRAFT_659997 [Helicostylum pulchrum]
MEGIYKNNEIPEEPDDKVYKAFFNRKSKLATLLTPNYKVYENLFRKVAEEFTIARRDALNFVLFMVIQWFNTQCVELFAYQTQQVPQIQIYLRRILHETFLMNQLRDLLQQTTNSLQQEQIIPNHQRLDELLVELNNNINSQEGQLECEQQRTAQDNLSLHIHLVLLDLHPQFTDLRTVTARAAEAAENVKATTEEQLTALFNSVTENQQAVLQNARNLRDLERKILVLRGKLATILREPLEQADNVRLRTIRQIQIEVLSSQAALQRMREQELRDQDFLNQNEIAQEYIRNTQILLQTIDIAENFTKSFQIVDSTLQQIVLALRDPEYNFIFPSVTDETFWSHVYRKVLADPENDNRRIVSDSVARVILGTTNKEEPYKLSHDSSSSHQRKIRKRYRRTIIRRFSQNPRPSYPPSIRTPGNNNQRTVVAYGDASIRSTYKGNTPIPVKAIQRAIATKALVIPVDEFRTKKLHRSNGQDGHPDEKKAVLKCFNEENHVLHKTSECPERVRPGRSCDIYPLKLCRQCQAGNNAGPLYWNRDVNAASNIRQILTAYVEQGFDLESRPEQLSRGIRQQDEDNEET